MSQSPLGNFTTFQVGKFYTLADVQGIKNSFQYLAGKEIEWQRTIHVLRQGSTHQFWMAGPIADKTSNDFLYLGPLKTKSQFLRLLLNEARDWLIDYDEFEDTNTEEYLNAFIGLVELISPDLLLDFSDWSS